MAGYQVELPALDAADTVVLGLSIDAQPAKSAWAKTLGTITFDLLSDFYPHGDVARKYGVFREGDGISQRVFMWTSRAVSRRMKTYAIPEQPPMSELLGAVAAVE